MVEYQNPLGQPLLQAGEALADGYFADNDLLAAGAIAALREAGYRIPEDVAVVGFDDMPLCESLAPPLKIEVSTALVRRRST